MFQANRPDPEPKRRSGNPASAVSIIAGGSRCTGDLDCTGVLRIEGTLEGSVRTTDQALVTRDGSVVGNVDASVVLVAGTIRGNVTATERIELQEGADVEGDVAAPRVVIADGATFNGRLTMRQPVVGAQPKPSGAPPRRPVLASA